MLFREQVRAVADCDITDLEERKIIQFARLYLHLSLYHYIICCNSEVGNSKLNDRSKKRHTGCNISRLNSIPHPSSSLSMNKDNVHAADNKVLCVIDGLPQRFSLGSLEQTSKLTLVSVFYVLLLDGVRCQPSERKGQIIHSWSAPFFKIL